LTSLSSHLLGSWRSRPDLGSPERSSLLAPAGTWPKSRTGTGRRSSRRGWYRSCGLCEQSSELFLLFFLLDIGICRVRYLLVGSVSLAEPFVQVGVESRFPIVIALRASLVGNGWRCCICSCGYLGAIHISPVSCLLRRHSASTVSRWSSRRTGTKPTCLFTPKRHNDESREVKVVLILKRIERVWRGALVILIEVEDRESRSRSGSRMLLMSKEERIPATIQRGFYLLIERYCEHLQPDLRCSSHSSVLSVWPLPATRGSAPFPDNAKRETPFTTPRTRRLLLSAHATSPNRE
jgi:hypothetical protein